MGKTEITIFIILTNVVLLVFIVGIILFVLQYKKRKLAHEEEKADIEKQHKLDLLNSKLQIQQQTMQFIGSEIHDSVTQKLTLASIYSQKLEFENENSGAKNKLHQITGIINDSLMELRDLSKTLTNNHIQEAVLSELLNEELEKVNETGDCKMQLLFNFNGQMNITVKSFLFRIIQEFIQNSLKHSGCSIIKVVVQSRPDDLFILASDNGRGFNNENSKPTGIGLANMMRRIHTIGGKYSFQTKPGMGTSLEITIDNSRLTSELNVA